MRAIVEREKSATEMEPPQILPSHVIPGNTRIRIPLQHGNKIPQVHFPLELVFIGFGLNFNKKVRN